LDKKKETEKNIKKDTIKDMAQWKNDGEVCSKDAAKK
jgi:hypothetical protein